MRGRSRPPRPLASCIVLALPIAFGGCVADARSLPNPTASPTATARPDATARVPAAVVATPSVTLPPTLAEPTPTPVPASTEPSPDTTPKPTARLDPPPRPGPFSMNLYHRGDFATQVSKIYCVPGAMQTMMNVMDRGATRASRTVQDRLYKMARRLSTDRLRGQGAEPEGWARGLERLGYGGYEVVVAGSRTGAIRAAARALRMTERPVGLLVWRGAHAWVMTGFKATADPAKTEKFEVTHVRIVDVWYPRVSSIWGASVKPNTLVPAGKLKEDYLPWRRPLMRYPDKDRRFIVVAPVADVGAADVMG
jgi:hypothetical protein